MIVAVYFDDDGAKAYPLDQERFFRAYYELTQELEKRRAKMIMVRTPESYLGSGRFNKHWAYDGPENVIEGGEIQADVIYDKGSEDTFKFTDGNIINPRFINELCVDKHQTAKTFQDLSPKTDLVKSAAEYQAALDGFQAHQKVVIKPNQGFEGSGIRIISKDEALKHPPSPQQYPVLVQEFIDTSGGISGVVDGVHDLRVFVLNGRIVMSYVRVPAEGSLLANVALGGSVKIIDSKTLPESVSKLVDQVDLKFRDYPKRLYSVDLAQATNGRFYLIELNSRPGISEKARGPEAVAFMEELAEMLATTA